MRVEGHGTGVRIETEALAAHVCWQSAFNVSLGQPHQKYSDPLAKNFLDEIQIGDVDEEG